MRLNNIKSDEEYKRRVLEGDNSIYLPQPNDKFPATRWDHRAAHALGVDYQGLQDKIRRGEVKDKIGGQIEILEDGKYGEMWRDEDPQALF